MMSSNMGMTFLVLLGWHDMGRDYLKCFDRINNILVSEIEMQDTSVMIR